MSYLDLCNVMFGTMYCHVSITLDVKFRLHLISCNVIFGCSSIKSPR